MTRVRLALALAACLVWTAARAGGVEPVKFERLTRGSGLPSSTILAVTQDASGQMWLGTDIGLLRYDGRKVSRIGTTESGDDLSDSLVYALRADDLNRLWVGTESGLHWVNLDSDQVHAVPSPAGLSGWLRRVTALAPGLGERQWVLCLGGLFLLDATTMAWEAVPVPLAGGTGPSRLLVTGDRRGGAWVSSGMRAYHLGPTGRIVQVIDAAASDGASGSSRMRRPPSRISSLMLDEAGRLWLGQREGVQVWEALDSTPRRSAIEASLARVSDVSSLFTDSVGDVWLSAGGVSLYRWRHETGELQAIPFKLSHRLGPGGDTVGGFYSDADGVLWITTWDVGLALTDVRNTRFIRYTHEPGDANSLSDARQVSGIVPLGAGRVLASTYAGGLNLLDIATGDNQRLPTATLDGAHIKVMLEAAPDTIWIGTEFKGLYRFNPLTRRAVQVAIDPAMGHDDRSVNGMVIDAAGRLWVATIWGVRRLDSDGQWRDPDEAGGALGKEVVNTLVAEPDGAVWVGGRNGVRRWDPQTQRFGPAVQVAGPGGAPLHVNTMKRDDAGNIWVGAVRGLYRVEPTASGAAFQLRSWSQLPGLPPGMRLQDIRAIQDSRDGMVWVAGAHGMARVDPRQRHGRAIQAMSEATTEFFYGAAARSEDGHVFFGAQSLLAFRPAEQVSASKPPRVALSQLFLFNQPVADAPDTAASGPRRASLRDLGIPGALRHAQGITLAHGQNVVGFEFAALSFGGDPASTSFAWQLRGFDRDWTYGRPGASHATYTNLDPGRYELQFKAMSPDGAWSDSPGRLAVVVLPPFWRTWWWYLSVCLLMAAAVWLLYRWRIRRLGEARARLEQQVVVRTQQVIDQQLTLVREKAEAEHQRTLAEQARRNIGLLSDIGRDIMVLLDAEAIYLALSDGLAHVIDADEIRVFKRAADGAVADVVHAVARGEPKRLPSIPLKDPALLVSRCLRGEQLLVSSGWNLRHGQEVGGEPPTLGVDAPAQARSALFVPLSMNGATIGAIAVYSHAHAAYGALHLDMLRTLAAHVSGALGNADAYERLQFTQDQLVQREKMAALGSLVAGVAHELNTPLGNSVLLASTLMDSAASFSARSDQGVLKRSELISFCDTVQRSSALLLGSLRSAATLLRSFKQVAVDQTADLRREFDLRGLCEELVATMANQLTVRHHTLQLEVAPDILMESYPGSLEQVLGNLILNALQHGFDGRTHGHMRLQADKAGLAGTPGQVRIVFTDDGAGITPEHLPHVFEPFYTTRLGRGGSGLGLNISYNIVTTLLGGQISVASQPGQGTRFEIVLPRVSPSVAA